VFKHLVIIERENIMKIINGLLIFMCLSLPLAFSDTVEVKPEKAGTVGGLESLGFQHTGGSDKITRNDDGEITKTESTSIFVKENADGSKENRTSTTEYDGEVMVSGDPVKATETTTKIGKNGKPTSSVRKDYNYSKDHKGVSWRSGAKKTTKTTFGKNGKRKSAEVRDWRKEKVEDIKYDKRGVKEESTAYGWTGNIKSKTEYDAKGKPNRTDWMDKSGKRVVQTKDYGKKGHTMTRYREDGSVLTETKFDKNGNATEGKLHLRDGRSVKTTFKNGRPFKSTDYDKNGNPIGVQYHDKPDDIARETGDSTGIFSETGDSTGIFNVVDDFFGDDLDARSMQADIGTQPHQEHY